MNEVPQNHGAIFRKCDFQIHSLRDANWSGDFHPINDRQAFADALIVNCRRKGVQAIAITDHHDLCLWRLIYNSAQLEKRLDGTILPANQRLVVFPGVELSLSTPSCQALLLLDPDLPDRTLAHIWGALRVIPSDPTAAKTTQTVALPVEMTIDAIRESLDQLRINPEESNPGKFLFLRGKFILLPNVKVGGHKTLMRLGNHTTYASMAFVGGYVEKCNYSDMDVGDRNILEGGVAAWGAKAVGVFQTSDCREARRITAGSETFVDFVDLGRWPTWVKWALPSTEALRQACLARSSRITHREPVYPLLQILGCIVSNSQFLGAVELGLNPQFNAFIGGRGTGKSSLIEYIRWALCDDPLEVSDTSELPNFQKRRKSLVDGTLRTVNGTVTLFYKRNEVIYKIVRSISAQDDRVTVYDASGTAQQMTPEQIRRDFPIVSYAQKQLSCVGTLPDEINRLITDPIKDQMGQIHDKIEQEILPALRQQRTRELRLTTISAELAVVDASIKGRKEQVLALQAQLQALSPAQQAVINTHESFTQRQQWLIRSTELPGKAATLLTQAKAQVNALGAIMLPDNLTDKAKVQAITTDASNYVNKAIDQLNKLILEAESASWLSEEPKRTLTELQSAFTTHQGEYDKCVADSAKNKKQLDEIQSLNRQAADLESKKAMLETERNAVQVLFDENKDQAWRNYMRLLRSRAKLLLKQCRTIITQAQREFRPKLAFCSDERLVRRSIEKLVEGRSVRDSDDKVRHLARLVISSRHPVKKWAEVMAELGALLSSKGSPTSPPVPLLEEAGFSRANIDSIRNAIDQDQLELIRFLNMADGVLFEFRMGTNPDGSEHYIPFESASPGQQATCLLRTLLAQSGAPLLIDQPEEDLDNEQIHLLSERIAETKHNRQLLFVSHNANIVVNGDAELVVCFGNRAPNDNTRGKIGPVGSIDCSGVRDTITAVMEGGRQAFELRKQKYGF